MSNILGMTASAASAHKHEFSAPRDAAMNQQQHPITHPLQYLHGKLQAFTTACASVVTAPSTKEPLIAGSDGNESETSAGASLEVETNGASSINDRVYGSKKSSIKVPTTKTSYLLSHPAPRARTSRIRQRNRMLLQLRKAAEGQSPAPALEVFPGNAFSKSMSRRLPHALKHHHTLNNADLVVLNCQPYVSSTPREDDDGHSDGERLDLGSRDILGSIHLNGEDSEDGIAEINVGSSQWAASNFEKGRYEFRGVDDEGNEVIARWWVKHSKKSKRISLPVDGESDVERKFNFSVLRPGTRKHPIIGRMDQFSIDILDQYTIPDSPTGSLIAIPSESFSPLSLGDGTTKSYFATTYPAPNSIVQTSRDLKKLILVTGVWVAASEGWSEALNSHFEGRSATTGTSSTLRLRSASGKVCDGRAEISANALSNRSRVPSWSHRHSSSVPTAESPIRSHFHHRSGTITAITGSIRRRSGMKSRDVESHSSVEDIAEDKNDVQPMQPETVMEEATTQSTDRTRALSGQGDLTSEAGHPFNGRHEEQSRGIRGMIKRSNTKSGSPAQRSSRLLGMIPRRPKH